MFRLFLLSEQRVGTNSTPRKPRPDWVSGFRSDCSDCSDRFVAVRPCRMGHICRSVLRHTPCGATATASRGQPLTTPNARPGKACRPDPPPSLIDRIYANRVKLTHPIEPSIYRANAVRITRERDTPGKDPRPPSSRFQAPSPAFVQCPGGAVGPVIGGQLA